MTCPGQHSGSLAPALALALALLATAGPAAAGLQVQVQDAQGRPLAGAVVFLESREARAATKPMAAVDIAQQDRQFQPQVSVVTLGTAVHFPNRDTVRHHVYSFSPVKRFEIKLYIGTPAQPVVFDQPGIAVLGCNIHDTMAAWVLVLETPWHARTGADGRAQLDAPPPGAYKLRAWHPGLPPGQPAAEQAVQLPASGHARAELRLAATP
jgi:plastocyanin